MTDSPENLSLILSAVFLSLPVTVLDEATLSS